jgi:hypothetical protein
MKAVGEVEEMDDAGSLVLRANPLFLEQVEVQFVPAFKTCASGCAVIWVAGRVRNVALCTPRTCPHLTRKLDEQRVPPMHTAKAYAAPSGNLPATRRGASSVPD